MDEVGLDEAFCGGGADLEGFEEGVEACHGLGDAFGEVGERGGGSGGGVAEEGGETFG